MLPLVLILFGSSMLLVLLSYAPWAQQRMPWITSMGFYLVMGGLLGTSLMVVALYFAEQLSPLVEIQLPE
ncbi:hypothetical protein [Paenibacillus sp. YYML68]|uniref:hypothetical protein n=1 Tax=Paenibacillus sp. YYML68 TaxID=2909250 RepID=UPI002491BFDE|nr:hypothetical protein [Paenibacillus sp. YYML68]